MLESKLPRKKPLRGAAMTRNELAIEDPPSGLFSRVRSHRFHLQGNASARAVEVKSHPRLFRATADALKGILDDIGLALRLMRDTNVLNQRITENRSCRVRRIIFGGQPISTTRSIEM